jgi:hypothetical protein
MINLELYNQLITILNNNGYKYIIDNDQYKECIAVGIGDILFRLVNMQENLVSKPVYINLDLFQSGYFKADHYSESQVWFNNPYNNFIFRINLLNDIIKYNSFLDKKDFIFVITKFNACILSKVNTNFNYRKIQNYRLLVSQYFYDNVIISDSIKEFISMPYIIFHTKLRLNPKFDYAKIRCNLGIFFSHLKIKKFNIILMGEKIFPQTTESNIQGTTTIYPELLKLHNYNSNKILDLTKEIIYNDLNYDLYKNDIYLINKATYNICYGQGGQLCSALLFGKAIFCDPLDVDSFYNNINLYKSGHKYFKRLYMMNRYLIEIL